jgi:hypothetical protein
MKNKLTVEQAQAKLDALYISIGEGKTECDANVLSNISKWEGIVNPIPKIHRADLL